MNLGDVMDEVGDRLDTLDGLRVYRHPPDQVQPPAAVVTYPETLTHDETFRRGMDRITLPVILLLGKVSARASRDLLDDWLSRSGNHRHRIEKVSQLTKRTMTVDSPNVSQAEITDDGTLEFTLSAGNDVGFSNLRDLYLREDVVGEDFHARATFDPPFFGDAGGGVNILPQHGLVLRYQRDTIQRAVLVWQNIFLGLPSVQIGVWQANLDGTGFGNRQQSVAFPGPLGLGFPYTVEAILRDNVVIARVWEVGDRVPEWNDPVFARTVNLDTEAGNAVTIPTPVGEGCVGVVAAHLGTSTSPQSMVRYRLADTYFELDSVALKETLEADLEAYTAFDTLRVTDVEFDIIQMAGVEYLAAQLNLDIAGDGA